MTEWLNTMSIIMATKMTQILVKFYIDYETDRFYFI